MAITARPRLRRLIMWGAIAAILLAPAIAMRFTREVAWTALDFAFAATLLVGAGLAYEFAESRLPRTAHRLAVAAALLAAVLAVWAQGAVGIF